VEVRGPGGLLKAIKFVAGSSALDSSGGVEQELRALQHVKTIRHPFLLSIERVEIIDSDLLIVMELADRSLHDLLVEQRAAGRAGIPRGELLSYLHEAAEVLDLMNLVHGLQHLDIKPCNLFLVGRHIKVADFGQVNSLAAIHKSDGPQQGAATPTYAAPETFLGEVTPFTDQYSLAVTYHELLTGEPVFLGKGLHQLVVQHHSAEPDLTRAPESDRPALARALAKSPPDRFPSCTAFVEALLAATPFEPPRKTGTTSIEINLTDTSVVAVGNSAVRAPPAGAALRPPDVSAIAAPAPRTSPSEGALRGHQLLECVGRTPGGEVWSARAVNGQTRLIKFLVLPAGSENAVARLRCLHHPRLTALEIVACGPARLALISDPGERTLAARWKECQAAGLPGIPRPELLGHLRQAAEALDELRGKHGLHHLGLSPRQIAVRNGRVQLHDFGLTELFWLGSQGSPAGLLSPRYAPPELFDGAVSDTSDPYSLALIFQELLVGIHAFRNLNQRQLATPRLRGQPDLSLVPAPDRPLLLRALHASPEQRFQNCTELIDALEGAAEPPAEARPKTGLSRLVPVLRSAAAPDWQAVVDDWLQAAVRNCAVRNCGSSHYLYHPGQRIEQRAWARVVPGTLQLKLGGFREQWQGEPLTRPHGRFAFLVSTAGSLWQRCLGRAPGLQVEVRVGAPREGRGGLAPVRVVLEPADCGPAQAERLLEETGPGILLSLQTYLHSEASREEQEHFPLQQEVRYWPVEVGGKLGPVVHARAVNVSRTGMALHLPCLPSSDIVLLGPAPGSPREAVRVPARIVHAEKSEGSGHEIEVTFGESS
jgi:serine/threonine protein kinase